MRSWRSLTSRSKPSSAASARAAVERLVDGRPLRDLERRFERGERGELEQSGSHARLVLARLIACRPRPRERLGQRAELLVVGLRLMLARGNRLARPVERGMRFLGLKAKGFGGLPCLLGLARCCGQLRGRGGRARLGLGASLLQRLHAAPLDEPRAGGARRAGLHAIAVPAPEIAVLRHEPLPGREARLQLAPARQPRSSRSARAGARAPWEALTN